MKKLFLSLFSLLAVALLTPSCTNEKEVNPADATAEVSFEVNLLGNPNEETKAYTNDLGKCATQEELQDLAAAGKLMLHFTIGTTTHDVKIIWNGSKFISAPLLLSAGTYSVSAATVTDGSGTLLFSGVANSSPYASYVPELLPKTFTIGTEAGNIPLYQKSILDLYMLCVLNETPEKFGFVKWNIHFSKLYCVPFIINKCANTGEDFVATGTITVKNGTYDEKTFTPATGKESPKWAVVNKTDNFPTTNGVGYLCFADNYDIDNTIEYYQITLNITSPTSVAETIVGYASVAALLQYNNATNNNAWNATQNTIHLDFCNCKTWFFPCVKPQPVCEGTKTIDISKGITDLSSFKGVVQTQLANGAFADGFAGLTVNSGGLNIPANTKIRIMSPVSLTTGIKSFANIFYSPLSLNTTIAPTVYKVNIYSDQFNTLSLSTSCSFSLYKNTYGTEWSMDAPTCIERPTNCYYIEFEFVKAVPSLTKLLIDIAPKNECPTQSKSINA